MAEAEGNRVEAVITKWRGTYGFAETTLGNDNVDVFIHAQKFETHKGRKTAIHGGLQEGDRIAAVINPPRAQPLKLRGLEMLDTGRSQGCGEAGQTHKARRRGI